MRFLPWIAAALLAAACGAARAGDLRRQVSVAGQVRSYTLHVPSQLDRRRPAALVLAFHGGGGQGRQMSTLSRFSALAERERFLVAYPDGLRGHWNDGRRMPRGLLAQDADDIGFVSALLDDVARVQAVDPRRVFATGMSNGAIFSHTLARALPDRIAAVAAVAGGIAAEAADDFKPALPVSALIIHGTADPIVPYAGGRVARTHGHIVATETAVQLWLAADALRGPAAVRDVPAAAAGDCAEHWRTWTRGRNGSAVTVVTLDGGGHTWPGGPQYLPKFAIGATCPELDATRVIWQFFEAHPKP